MPINAVLKRTTCEEDRGAERFRLQLHARGSQEEASAEVIVQELSATGFLIESDFAFAAGESLSVEIPGVGAVEATLIWNSGRYFGGEFERRLPSAALKSALSASKVVGPSFRATSASERAASAAEAPLLVQRLSIEQESGDEEQRLPVHRRAQLIVGTSLLLWGGIAGAGWAALS